MGQYRWMLWILFSWLIWPILYVKTCGDHLALITISTITKSPLKDTKHGQDRKSWNHDNWFALIPSSLLVCLNDWYFYGFMFSYCVWFLCHNALVCSTWLDKTDPLWLLLRHLHVLIVLLYYKHVFGGGKESQACPKQTNGLIFSLIFLINVCMMVVFEVSFISIFSSASLIVFFFLSCVNLIWWFWILCNLVDVSE